MNNALPVYAGPGECPDCWAIRGQEHQLSCPEVSYEQFCAVMQRHDRRDRRFGIAERVILLAAVLLAVALVWVVAR